MNEDFYRSREAALHEAVEQSMMMKPRYEDGLDDDCEPDDWRDMMEER